MGTFPKRTHAQKGTERGYPLFALLWAAELGNVREGILIGVGALAPLALGVGAIKTYYAMEPEENDRKILLASFGPFILYSVILSVTAVGLPGLV